MDVPAGDVVGTIGIGGGAPRFVRWDRWDLDGSVCVIASGRSTKRRVYAI